MASDYKVAKSVQINLSIGGVPVSGRYVGVNSAGKIFGLVDIYGDTLSTMSYDLYYFIPAEVLSNMREKNQDYFVFYSGEPIHKVHVDELERALRELELLSQSNA